MNRTIIAASAAASLVTGGAAVAVYELVRNGQPINQTLSNAATAVRGAAVSAAATVSPTLRNTGVRASREQVARWCEKVGRTQGPRGITEVDRVRTSPYINAAFPIDLHGFARFAGEGTNTGLPGGTILAVLLSIETWAGVKGRGERAACYNFNFGNSKLWRSEWHADVTRPCYFLVDQVPSLDFYPSMNTPADGVRIWAETTFGNRRYDQYGTMAALRAGNIRAFCRAIGQGGYARMYRNPRAMDARCRLMANLGRYGNRNGPPVIDGSQIVFDDSIL